MKSILLLLVSAAVFSAFFLLPVSSLSCGKVYSGPSFDRGNNRDQQSSHTRLQANWEGFNRGGSGRVTYTYAAISEDIATKAITDSGPNAPESKRCRKTPGFTKDADLVDFQFGDVGTNTSVQIKRQPLVVHKHYYVIIRATQGRSVTYSNTDSIFVKEGDDDDDLEDWEIGLIAMAAAICCLLLLALLILLLVVAKMSRGDDKYTTTVHRNENVDKL